MKFEEKREICEEEMTKELRDGIKGVGGVGARGKMRVL